MQQDEDFLPYGIDGSVGPLPRNSLDGEVYVYSARAGITSRPFKPLRLKAQYSYDERDNDTPHEDYTYNRMDSGSLTLGNDTEEYNVFAFMVAVQHRF